MSTIKEIARMTGVSIGTVDRALNNRGRVSEATREKVLKAAEEIGYTTNIFARNLKLSKVFNFSIVMPNPENDSSYWKLPMEGIDKAIKDLGHYKLKTEYFFYNKYNPESISKSFAKALKHKCDGMIIVPAGESRFEKLLSLIPGGIPYVFFDSLVPDTPYLSYIGQDANASGASAARLMDLLCGDNSRLAVLNFSPEDYHIEQRTKGFCSHFKSLGKRAPEVFEICPDYKKNLVKCLDKLFEKPGGKIKGLFVTNASTYLVAGYLKKRKLEGKVKLIGYDLIKENVKYLKEGVIDFIISQMSERQGYESVRMLVNKVVLKQDVNRKKYMQIDIITKENVDYYQS